MLLRHILIALVIFSMVIAGSALIVSDMNVAYGNQVNDSNFNATYNKLTDIHGNSSQMINKVNASEGIVETGADLFFTGTWSTIKLFFNSFDLMTNKDTGLIASASKDVLGSNGIDGQKFAWFSQAIVTIISITVVFIILSTLLKRPM